MNDTPSTLEEALEAVERDADAALKSLSAAVRVAKRAKAAAASGQIRDLEQSMAATTELVEHAALAVEDLRAGWSFDVTGYFGSGEYAKELLAAATEAG